MDVPNTNDYKFSGAGKTVNKLLAFAIITVLISIVIMESPWGETKRINDIKESFLSKKVSGIVQRVFMDKENHNNPTILIESDGNIKSFDLTFVTNYSEIMKELEPNDSIIKEKDELKIEIIKNDRKHLTIPIILVSPN